MLKKKKKLLFFIKNKTKNITYSFFRLNIMPILIKVDIILSRSCFSSKIFFLLREIFMDECDILTQKHLLNVKKLLKCDLSFLNERT